jgi:uncharacterized membrane protein YhaH (DUF805 family)
MDFQALFFKPGGRISPQTFWAGFGVLSAISLGVLFVPVVGGLLCLLTLFPWSMLNAKRLHDLGRSGWFQLVQHLFNIGIVLTAGAMIGGGVLLGSGQGPAWRSALDAGAALGMGGGFLLTGGLIAFNILWLIWLGGSPGKPYENRWGRPTNWP